MNWDSYDTISDSISIRDILFTEGELGLYDIISDAQPEGQGHSISICDILLGLYDTISDSMNVRNILLELYDTISDSISVRDILLEFI